MAVSNSGMTLYTDNNTQQNWSGTDGLDAEVSNDGGGSESWLVGKNGNETGVLTLAANMGTSKYFTFWMKSDWGAFYTAINATLSDGTNNNLFNVATGGKNATPNLTPEISGDFKPSILQIDQGSAGGTYNPANHTSMSINVDASSTGNIRAIVNHWIDGMYYGSGRTITGTTTTDKLFVESDALDTSTATYDGCSKIFDSGLVFYTDVVVNTTTGNSYGEVVTWYGKATTDGIFGLSITGTADFQNTSLIGRNSTIGLDASAAASFNMTGGGITNGGVITFGSGNTVDGVVFASCGSFTIPNAVTNSTFSGSGLITLTGSLTGCKVQNSTSSASVSTTDLGKIGIGTEFTSDGSNHAVELTSLGSGSMTWYGKLTGYETGAAGSPVTATSTGNEAIFVNVASGTLTINVGSGGTIPSIRTAGAVVTIPAASYALTLTDGFTSTDRAKLNSIENFDDTALTVAVGAIPTNPLLSTDTRLANLDAKVSTRAVPADLNVDNGFTALDRTKLNSLSNYNDESLLDALALVETAVVAGQITPADVWNHATRTLTQQVSLSTAESQHLLGLTNYDDTTLVSKVNAIPLDTLRTTDVRLNRLDANISSRAKPTDLQVTFDNGFTDSDRLVLNALENYSDVAVKSLIANVDTKVTAAKAHTDTLSNYTSLAADLDAYSNKSAWKADTSGISAVSSKVTSIESKVDAIDTSLDTTALHTALDTYPNKSQWKAVFNPTDLTPVLNAIAALNNLSLLDIEGSTVLAKQATLDSIVTAIAAIPTTDSVADLSPVLAAIANLNDVTPAEVRAAFNAADFKDKNTQAEIHAWLDSYANKDSWKADTSTVAADVWSKVV